MLARPTVTSLTSKVFFAFVSLLTRLSCTRIDSATVARRRDSKAAHRLEWTRKNKDSITRGPWVAPMTDVEKAIVALLEQQEDVEERKRMEKRRTVRLEQEINLTSKLLEEAASRLESLDGEIESHRSRILEGQKYHVALQALCEEEVFKARGLRETVGQMQDHADEQRELIGTFYNHLLKKGVPKQELDATVIFGKGHR